MLLAFGTFSSEDGVLTSFAPTFVWVFNKGLESFAPPLLERVGSPPVPVRLCPHLWWIDRSYTQNHAIVSVASLAQVIGLPRFRGGPLNEPSAYTPLALSPSVQPPFLMCHALQFGVGLPYINLPRNRCSPQLPDRQQSRGEEVA